MRLPASFLLVVIAFLALSCGSSTVSQTPTVRPVAQQVVLSPTSTKATATVGPAATATPRAPSQAASPAPAVAATPATQRTAGALVPVAEVVDGDTIKVRLDGKTESIRIIGIDTPEVVDPRKVVQCFGREASAMAHELLDGQQVAIVPDATQDTRDKYGRLLGYVEKANGTDFGLWMVANGYAHEYTYQIPYQRQSSYKAAEAQAREKSSGFWSPSACNGDTEKAAGIGADSATAPALAPVPTKPVAPAPTPAPAPVTASGLEIVSLTSPVAPGGTARLAAKTAPSAQCNIVVRYKSGPSSASGLGPRTAGADGSVAWSWTVGRNTTAGDWPVTVTCGKDSQTATLSVR